MGNISSRLAPVDHRSSRNIGIDEVGIGGSDPSCRIVFGLVSSPSRRLVDQLGSYCGVSSVAGFGNSYMDGAYDISERHLEVALV